MSLKRSGVFFLIVFGITIVDFFYLKKPTTGIDDANIFLTYAHHLANGQGFVFNAGGERVEGFTSMLWVLICALFSLIFTSPEIPLLFFLMLLTTITITMVYEELRKDVDRIGGPVFKKYFFWFYCAFLICIGPAYIVWSVLSLMENGLWNFLFIWMVILSLQAYRLPTFPSGKKLTLLLAGTLLLLTRPEGLAWVMVFTIILLLAARKSKSGWIFPSLFFIVMAIVSAGLAWFRLKYFGYPFPNTYYAKVSHDIVYNVKSGLSYAVSFIATYHALLTLLLTGMIVFSLSHLSSIKSFFKRNDASDQNDFVLRTIIVTGIIVVALFLPFTTGGDHFGGFRFYQGIILLFAWGLPVFYWFLHSAMVDHIKSSLVSLGIVIAVFFLILGADSLYILKNLPRTQLDYEFYLASSGRTTAESFNKLWKNNPPSVGVVTVGGFSLRYKGETVDLMGLNNVRMGHNKGERIGIKNHAAFNKDVFYELKPDLLVPKELADEKDAALTYADMLGFYNFDNRAMKYIFNDAAFQQAYQPVVIRSYGSKPFFTFASNEFLGKIQNDSSIRVSRIVL